LSIGSDGWDDERVVGTLVESVAPIKLPIECEVPRDAEPVGDPLAREPSGDLICGSQLLTHRMLPDNEIGLPPRIDRPADGQPGPDPDCA
jgi:hypothetical protein